MKCCEYPGGTTSISDTNRFCMVHVESLNRTLGPTPLVDWAKLNSDKLPTTVTSPLAKQYPKYYKDVSNIDSIDVYGVHQIFGIEDPSGCIQHASKPLLLSGVRTGGKSKFKDIKEARDTLNRWLELNPETT